MKKLNILFLFICYSWGCIAQPMKQMIQVSVVPNSENWLYKLGKDTVFTVTVTKNGIPMKGIKIRYELSQDMLEPFKQKELLLKDGITTINAGTLRKAGFLRCRAFVTIKGNTYEGRGTAGYEPHTLLPTTEMPADFQLFWEQAKAGNKEIAMNPCLRLLPEKCTSKVDVYELSVQSFQRGSRMFGILCIPKTEKKCPALLRLPGAGVRPYEGHIAEAEKGYITLDIGIHGIPVTMPASVYHNLRSGSLDKYWNFNWEDRDMVYYKRVYLGCIRMVDYIYSMQEFNGDLIVYGGSQGGALSLITAALDNRVTGCVVFFPALADLNGYLHGRAGGWPHYFKDKHINDPIIRKKEQVMAYYDVTNFARILNKPVFFSFGYNDMVCPPTTSYAVYNSISSPKTFIPAPETEHYNYPELWEEAWKWGEELLKAPKK